MSSLGGWLISMVEGLGFRVWVSVQGLCVYFGLRDLGFGIWDHRLVLRIGVWVQDWVQNLGFEIWI